MHYFNALMLYKEGQCNGDISARERRFRIADCGILGSYEMLIRERVGTSEREIDVRKS